ncbi:MAG: carboxypeptidase-like regulatory domain-containing protein [Bacteroidales bacterium]
MTRIYFFAIILIYLSFVDAQSQTKQDSTGAVANTNELKGMVLDANSQTALSYTNIYNLHKGIGVISNELGHFSIDLSELDKTDTLRFQYVGYKTQYITIGQLETNSVVYLKEEIINLNETIVFGNNLDVVSIVKNVLKHKDANYKKATCKKQAFIREREIVKIKEVALNYKKSTIDELDREMIAKVEKKIPKYTTSYTDFLGDLYFTKNPDDSVKLKIEPIRTVSLKEKNIAELDQVQSIFENLVSNTEEEEYWKIKSGVFGQKLETDEEYEIDTVSDYKSNLSFFTRRVKYQLKYSTLDDKDQWEFLHSTGKYKYTLAGGTRVNGEDVYIIDFTPDGSGKYLGRMYIAINTFALIRADYEYAPDKTGTDFHLLGVGYTETQFSGSIFFEKKEDNYMLKYFSYKNGADASIDRSIALLKKKKRLLFDKTLKELKIGLELSVHIDQSIEYLVLHAKEILKNNLQVFSNPKLWK